MRLTREELRVFEVEPVVFFVEEADVFLVVELLGVGDICTELCFFAELAVVFLVELVEVVFFVDELLGVGVICTELCFFVELVEVVFVDELLGVGVI